MPYPQDEAGRLRELYAGMSDEELGVIAAAAHDLTDEATAALRDEIHRRNLGIRLGKERPEHEIPDPRELVTVGAFTDLAQAMSAKAMLEGAGIECFLTDENTFRLIWLYTPMLGAMRLQTRATDADDAAALLGAPPSSREDDQQT